MLWEALQSVLENTTSISIKLKFIPLFIVNSKQILITKSNIDLIHKTIYFDRESTQKYCSYLAID